MRHSHEELARGIRCALEKYLRAVGPQALGWYVDSEGDWQELDDQGWRVIQDKLGESGGGVVRLHERPDAVSGYSVEYRGRRLEGNAPGLVCGVAFWLPTEYLHEHGPGRVRELALELGTQLPFNSGHAGLAFHFLYLPPDFKALASRYPGMDALELGVTTEELGTRVRGAHWLTFLGQPVLGELGSAAGLRSRLSSPDITVQEMEGDRAVVTLGPCPEAGDTERAQHLPLYRELARVLEPWRHHTPYRWRDFSEEEMHRWEHRFLD
ncbi:MAG TPA: type VI immunity family protein [Archangium sp.]|uniref:type VI immunity family protein n=1 Tax=Archangium sp. TaxID=1872627 RepID=UPI002E36FE66|nr:type VI immunity family protein [Archangium sp.]HEX5749905.1 type VI immunity family protein [Archangium sp.]